MIKIGTDICSISRVSRAYERFGQRFLAKILTDSERDYVLSSPHHLSSRLAGRFAAKEAAAKALGTGWKGISWKEVEVTRQATGAPSIILHGRAHILAKQLQLDRFEVSLSHDGDYATALVLAYREVVGE